MLKVGLTGSIAVGKSYVVSILKELGCKTFDADQIARQVVEPGKPAYLEIVSTFGREILQADGSINRVTLGNIVFADPEKRNQLNRIVHPHVIAEQDRLLKDTEKNNPDAIAIVDAALMIESGGYKRFDKIIVVFCDESLQVERLMRRNNLSFEEAAKRIHAQMSSSEKRKFADFEIDTSTSYEDTKKQTEQIYAKLTKLAAGKSG
ncbi:MAG TPA: dephospho-CoA kinase [Blastocatellia bacterium]|nr:dephospho-CoA kinase [Blastocatellia bacterium]